MTTLTALKAQIASDIDRTDLTTAIATEISSAIRHYQQKRFYFNETRDETFATVADQELYATGDDAAIPKFIKLDYITVLNGTDATRLEWMTPEDWEMLTISGTDTGVPTHYTRFQQKIGLYPIPNGIYTIRMAGHYMVAAPASDGEAGNVWMTEAYDLIRARVCAMLSIRPIRNPEMAQAHQFLEKMELDRLYAESASKMGSGYIMPTDF